MGKLELITKFKMEQENENLSFYKKAFPQARPTIFQMEMIEAQVDDPKAWQKAVIFWAGNNYRAESIFKMLDYYRQIKAGTVQTFEDTSKAKMRVGAEQPTETFTPTCTKCNDIGEVWGTGGTQPCPVCRAAA